MLTLVIEPFAIALLYGFGAFLSAYAALRIIVKRLKSVTESETDGRTLIFLLRNNDLVDANFSGHRLLQKIEAHGTKFARLKQYLSRSFDSVETLLSGWESEGDLTAQSRDGQTHLAREVLEDAVRIKITPEDTGLSDGTDIHVLRAMQVELETLRANTMAAPFLLWRQDPKGNVTWVNKAYLDTVSKKLGPESHSAWPLPVLFPNLQESKPSPNGENHRVSLRESDGLAWYDCHLTPLGEDVLCTAFQADEAVKSEVRRREFTQTLTKTFAELATGLAIFDRSRQLVLFNPALLDLTNLPTDFLTSRPQLISFLDRLREYRVMPEPRDYRSWRKSIADLEAAAADGTYSETWSLPDGQTFHVTGRPHPDGAVALLFEDISAEISLTRRFRSELEQSQDVLDAMDDAIAVFSGSGQLIMTNCAYGELWKTDHDKTLASINVTDATRTWHEQTTPTPVWGDFRDFAERTTDREHWSAQVVLRNGQFLTCHFQPLKGGATLVIFRKQAQITAQHEKLRQAV